MRTLGYLKKMIQDYREARERAEQHAAVVAEIKDALIREARRIGRKSLTSRGNETFRVRSREVVLAACHITDDKFDAEAFLDSLPASERKNYEKTVPDPKKITAAVQSGKIRENDLRKFLTSRTDYWKLQNAEIREKDNSSY